MKCYLNYKFKIHVSKLLFLCGDVWDLEDLLIFIYVYWYVFVYISLYSLRTPFSEHLLWTHWSGAQSVAAVARGTRAAMLFVKGVRTEVFVKASIKVFVKVFVNEFIKYTDTHVYMFCFCFREQNIRNT